MLLGIWIAGQATYLRQDGLLLALALALAALLLGRPRAVPRALLALPGPPRTLALLLLLLCRMLLAGTEVARQWTAMRLGLHAILPRPRPCLPVGPHWAVEGILLEGGLLLLLLGLALAVGLR
jgi:hypothetical protein